MAPRIQRLERSQVIPADVDTVFEFFSAAANLEALTPDWLSFEVLTPDVTMARGTTIDYRLRLHGVPMRWTSLIEVWEPGRRFIDMQIRGPYRLWSHLHEFEPHPDGTLVRDEVLYALPLGRLGWIADPLFVRRDLGRVFDFRHAAVERLLAGSPSGA